MYQRVYKQLPTFNYTLHKRACGKAVSRRSGKKLKNAHYKTRQRNFNECIKIQNNKFNKRWRKTSIINQQLHFYKVHIKTLKTLKIT